jgi:pyruvate, water dikinase
MKKRIITGLASVACLAFACSSSEGVPEKCEIVAGAETPDYLPKVGCFADFKALASDPIDATIPGARSVKVVLDQFEAKDTLYFQNSTKFKIHHAFATKYLSGPKFPPVPTLAEFNRNQYTGIQRRFILGAVTYYEGPKAWTLEIAPYDTATPAMIAKLHAAVQKSAYFGGALFFHPTSQTIEGTAKMLPAGIKIKTTADLFKEIDYQPLNPGSAMGKLRFVRAAELTTTYVNFREIVVLDLSPGDISVVAGMISEEFQTPLSHINVLAQNRGTPNMGLRKAFTNPQLRALDGKWVELVVKSLDYSIREVTAAEADAFWERTRPMPMALPPLNLEVKDLRNIEEVVVETPGGSLREAISAGTRAFGAKSAGYSVLHKTEGVPSRKAFGLPVYYYVQFMEQNGFWKRVDTLLADADFRDKPAVRDAKLQELRLDMLRAPIDPGLQALLREKLNKDYPGLSMRFRSSTNAEDLDGFPCAGCYDSHTGDPVDWDGDLLHAIRQTWATVWKFRTFEERSYRGIDHKGVAMALLCHHNFPDEEANGVAISANPFDRSGLEPGFYINVQAGGEAEVVKPPPGVTSDEFLYQYSYENQPIIFLSHSNLIPAGSTVLSRDQTHSLGVALDALHKRFSFAFGPAAGNTGWYAMDVEFKFDAPAGQTPTLFVKQARPFRLPKE